MSISVPCVEIAITDKESYYNMFFLNIYSIVHVCFFICFQETKKIGAANY